MEKVLYKKAVELLDAPTGDEWALATYLIIAQRFQSSTLMAPLVSSPSKAWWRPHLHHGSARRSIHDLLGKQGFRIFAYLAILYESGESLDAFEIKFNKQRAGLYKFYTVRSGWGAELNFVLLKDGTEVKV
ncbi:uncharacterized protein LOC62_07G009266 [Vanrija pseudolonga]|uniref:Uncharacterized protein n=1 Tax=Vanrija pseudolonga TaxID=143232 RepID=A0AAF0YFF8_9TREE|nr:hypothetical protein LOC62_07G009266 [Vanrija pseudolonga]